MKTNVIMTRPMGKFEVLQARVTDSLMEMLCLVSGSESILLVKIP